MKAKPVAKTNIFILELTIIILVFALTAAISVSLFVKAHQIEQKASMTNYALMKVQSMAEQLKNQPEMLAAKGEAILYFDESWQITKELANASYHIETSIKRKTLAAGSLATVKYAAYKIDQPMPLYRLQIENYLPRHGGGKIEK